MNHALIKEIDIMKKCNHPHIVKLYDYFIDEQYYYLVMEYIKMVNFFDILKIIYSRHYNH